MDVAAAIDEDSFDRDPHDVVGAGIEREQVGIVSERRGAVQPQAVRVLEIDEEQADAGILPEIAEGQEHAVPVVARKDQLARAGDAHEARGAALVGHGGLAVAVDGAEKDHRGAGDEVALGCLERVVRVRFQPVGEAARAVLVLKAAMALAEEDAHDFPLGPSALQGRCGFLAWGPGGRRTHLSGCGATASGEAGAPSRGRGAEIDSPRAFFRRRGCRFVAENAARSKI